MPLDFAVSGTRAALAGKAEGKSATNQATGAFLGRSASIIADQPSILAEAAEAMDMETGPDTDSPQCELDDWSEDDDDAQLASEELEKAREEASWNISEVEHLGEKENNTSLRDRIRQYKMLMAGRGLDERLFELGRSLSAGEGGEVLLNRASRLFYDETDTWVALYSLLEETRKNGASPAMARAVADALSILEGKKGPRILAGIHGALVAPDFEQAGSVEDLRNAYRSAVCDFTSVMEAFVFIKEKFQDRIGAALDFMFAAISADMTSSTPSMEKNRLAAVNGSLGKVRLLQSAHGNCEELLERWEKVHGVSEARSSGFTSMFLLEKLAGLAEERFLGAMHIEEIASRARIPDIEHEVLFYQELLGAARSMPIALMNDDAGRLRVLEVMQECVDRAVKKEDDWLAQGQ